MTFLFLKVNTCICCKYSLEASQREASNEYLQQTNDENKETSDMNNPLISNYVISILGQEKNYVFTISWEHYTG